MNKNICFKVFHVDGADNKRNELSEKINNYLIKYINELKTPTLIINSDDDVKDFLEKNKNFNLDINGYNLDNIQGWRYGEVGIWASNYIAWSNFINSEYEYAMLIEDDIIYNDNFILLLDKYINELPDDWDIFSFYVPPSEHHLCQGHHKIDDLNICRSYQDWSMLCYLVSRNGASKLINTVNYGVSLPLDWHIYRQTHLFNVYSIRPDVEFGCSLAPLNSTFQEKHERKILNGVL